MEVTDASNLRPQVHNRGVGVMPSRLQAYHVSGEIMLGFSITPDAA
jgi:hypothetical protein